MDMTEVKKELLEVNAKKALVLEKLSYQGKKVNDMLNDEQAEQVAMLCELSEEMGQLIGISNVYEMAIDMNTELAYEEAQYTLSQADGHREPDAED